MMIPGAIEQSYSKFDIFVQHQMLDEKSSAVQVITKEKCLIVDFCIQSPLFAIGRTYELQVIYQSQNSHVVWVKNPEITPSIAIHMYDNHSLCLYYPPDISPFRRIWIYRDLIPMATLWVQHYERWLTNGNDWKGWEAPGHWFLMQQLELRQKRQTEHQV